MRIIIVYGTLILIQAAFLVLALAGLFGSLRGETLDGKLLNATAHTGASYLITHSTQVVCTKLAGDKHKLTCTILGVALAASAGIAKEVVFDKGQSNKNHAKGYAADALGIGLAVTFIAIDW